MIHAANDVISSRQTPTQSTKPSPHRQLARSETKVDSYTGFHHGRGGGRWVRVQMREGVKFIVARWWMVGIR